MSRPRRPAAPAWGRYGLLTVGQTARIIGVSPSTLRLWESVGLVSPVRSGGRYRLYSSQHLALLKRIKSLRDVRRLNVPGIKEALGPRASRTADRAAAGTSLGPKLRRLRTRSGQSLAQAAVRAGVSAGFLSAIERERANASVATLQRLAAAYGTTVLDLFGHPKQPNRLVRPKERRALQTASGVRMEMLSQGTTMLQCMLFRVAPGGGSDGAYSHTGEEFIHMLAGTLEMWLDEVECHTLHPGDSFWFASTLGHRWHNPGAVDAVLIWINTPPTF